MTITVSYDKVSGYFIGHEATCDLYSAGLTWQDAIAATVDGVEAYNRSIPLGLVASGVSLRARAWASADPDQPQR